MNKTLDDTIVRLVDTGIYLFGNHGFDGISIRDIIKQANVNLSAISYHFGGKNEFYQTIVVLLCDEVKNKLVDFDFNKFQRLEIKEMRESLTDIIKKFSDMFLTERGVLSLNIFQQESITTSRPAVATYVQSMLQLLHNHFAKIFTIYYLKLGEPIEKVDFVFILMISILKNNASRKQSKISIPLSNEKIVSKLISLILNSKI